MNISVALQPDGNFVAIDRDNYDVDCDHTGFFTRSPTGYGRTPLDAIVDLIDETDALVVRKASPNRCHMTGNWCTCDKPILCRGAQ
jgi:hypothetical protein